MGGGSTSVAGPKKDGTSPEVVTGVFKSPDCVSMPVVADDDIEDDAEPVS